MKRPRELVYNPAMSSLYPPLAPLELPSSYNDLNLDQIKVFHVPESCPTPTPVILIKLWRPKNHNAFTGVMQDSLVQVYRMINADDRVKAVVLAADGRAFCAGADLDLGFLGTTGKGGVAAAQKSERDTDHRDGGGRVSLAIHQCSKPTVTAIQGAAVGVGITMTLPSAIRVAYSKAKIGFVFSRRGIIMEACSSFFLPRLVGLSRALHLTTTGAVYPAEHPLMRDLFSEILDTPEATVKRALEIADDIAKNTSTVSNKLMRDLMYRGPTSAEEAHILESKVIHGVFGSKDNNEGVNSFFDKRPANFTGTMTKDAPDAWPWWSQVDIGYIPPATSRASKL